MTPKGSDEGFLNKLRKRYGERKKEHKNFANPKPKAKDSRVSFIIKHFAGPVTYNVTGFEKDKDALHDDLKGAILCSENKFLVDLFAEPVAEKSASPKRGRRGGKKKVTTIGASFKAQLNSLMKIIKATEPHFIRCMKPNSEKQGDIFTASMMMDQLRFAGLLEVCRIRSIGYPQRRTFEEFLSRYLCLSPGSATIDDLINGILANGGILKKGEFQKGSSKYF